MTTNLKQLFDTWRGREDDGNDDAYNAAESWARMQLITAHVAPSCKLAYSQDVCDKNYAVEDKALYLGTHECGDRTVNDSDELYIELWAFFMEEDGADFITWEISTFEERISSKYPVYYCPFCGEHLRAFITTDIPIEERRG